MDPKENTGELNSTCNYEQIIHNAYDSFIVFDKEGTVILANPATQKLIDIPLEDFIGKNIKDLIKIGVYDRSIALEAIEKRSIVTGIVKTRAGKSIISTSTPIIDDNGEVVMAISNTRDKSFMDKYIVALNNEKMKSNRYKTVVEYLSDFEMDKNIITNSPQMIDIVNTSKAIAKTDSTIVLLGESGTGKEVMARFIHRNSKRASEVFIPVNCAAIPPQLMEAEFFGYVKGAFTGASNHGKPGLFEIASNGTLFLDEIGELPLEMQSKLLRVLETGQVQRLGSTETQQLDFRLITATNRDLRKEVEQNKFRSDLYYRINVIPIHLPPLRSRLEDIHALAKKFLGEFNKKYGFNKKFTEETKEELLLYDWPGNVRELRNVIERLVITSSSNEIHFHQNYLTTGASINDDPDIQKCKKFKGPLKAVLNEVEKKYIEQVLAECEGNITEAAKNLGIHRTVLYRKLEKYS